MTSPPSSPTASSRNLRLLLELGRGGMGVVYLALHQGPGGFTKLKVVKRLRPDLASEPGAVQMFLEEGRLSARLNHPNVVQTNEVGFDGEHYFLEMEYLEGQSLEAFTKRSRKADAESPLDRAVTLWVLTQALAGLHYAHELADHAGAPLQLVHRDVSPHNVFVTYDGHVKVLDFGIAKAADSQHETQTGVLKGKVTYMAPEQVARKGIDRRADVFAAGVILWQILAGERLWKDLDDFAIFLKLRSEAIASPRTVRPDVPGALEAICMRALASDPASRTPTAAEMQREIEGWLEANAPHVGPRELAARMEALFGEERAQVKLEVDRRIRATPATESVVGVPTLRIPASQSTASNALSASTFLGEGTRVRQQQQIRGLRMIALSALGIALVASIAASVSAIRQRRARAAAAADAGAAAAVKGEGCTSNRLCSEAHQGKAWVCRASDHACVAVDSPDCKAMAEPSDLAADDTVWLGAMFPMKGPAAEQWGRMNMEGVDFARTDLARVTASLGGEGSAGRVRHVALVGCDDSEDPLRSAHHMVDDVGVPAILGFQSGNEVVSVASRLLVPRGVLAVASITSNPTITRIPQPSDLPRMVWRTTYNFDSLARATSAFIPQVLEPRGRPGEKTRVAFAHLDAPGPLSFASTFYKTLRFNGKSAAENGRDFVEVTFGAPEDAASSRDAGATALEVEEERVARAVAEVTPTVVVLVLDDQITPPIVEAIEAGSAGKPRPIYLLVNTPTASLRTFVGASADRRQRALDVDAPTSPLANAHFVIRYNQAHQNQATRADNPGVSYDAFYLLAYSAFTVPAGAPMSGAALARGFARLLPPGKPIEVGPTDTLEAISALSGAGNIDLEGTQGGLDFDLATGEAAWDLALMCPAADAQGRANGENVESGVVYREKERRIEGELRCP